MEETDIVLGDVKQFKENATRYERRKRLKFFIIKYKEHMNKLNTLFSINKDSTEEDKELAGQLAINHMKHAMTLKNYIKAFIPKSWKLELLVFDKKTVFYNGKEL